VRIIYDERRGETDMAFLVAGLAWGGMLAVSAIAFSQDFLGIPPEQLVVPEASAELWAALWKAAGLGGGISLVFGLLGEGIATRIAVDERGIKKLRSWGGDCFLIEWANVRSWWVESYEKTSYVTVTRLVVELASTEKPFVVEDARYQTAVVAELSAVVPIHDGSSLSVWGRGTGGDFQFFRDETEFSDPNIRAAVAWLSTTLRQVLGLRATNEAVKFNG
jgi:hypothetical protein